MNIINTGGLATRLGPLAKYGCKALTMVGAKPIIEHQLDVLGEATIVCRSMHVPLLKKYGPCVPDDLRRGPGGGLLDVPFPEGPVTIVYADSYFRELPEGDGWVGVNPVQGGRWWDLVYTDGHVEYAPLPEGMTGRACVGLYRVPDGHRLRIKLNALQVPFGMAPVVNNWPGLDFLEIPSWRDVGDPEALARFAA